MKIQVAYNEDGIPIDAVLLDTVLSTTASYAFEVAKMVSNFEAASFSEKGYPSELGNLFISYLQGNLDESEINEILYKEWPEAFPGLKEK